MGVCSLGAHQVSCRLMDERRLQGNRLRAGVVARARYGPRRRWWSESWEDDSSRSGSGGSGGADFAGSPLDGGSALGAEQVTTFFCSDGSVVRLGPTPNPALAELERRRGGAAAGAGAGAVGGAAAGPADLLGVPASGGAPLPLPLPHEQGLCIGSIFSISATNGIDAARRLTLLGFCFSTEQLFERVEHTVLRRGGEVFETKRRLKSGVHECLHMRVAIPLLFGVPPEYERLKAGVIQGGGVIERVQQQWVIY